MGLFDFLKKKEKQGGLTYAPTMTGYNPTFTSFGENVYASDIVVQSIRCKANEFKKLDPRHIRTTDGRQHTVTDSSIARVLKRPNPYMTQADFLEKITILRELSKNCFIYPTYYITKGGEKFYTGLYPLRPQRVNYMQNDKGTLFIHFVFYDGTETTLPAADVIHWRKDYGVNDYFGGGAFGGDDNDGLLAMLERYDLLTQGIAQALKCSCQINGIAKLNTYATDDEQKQKEKEFQQRILNNEGGILFTDNKIEYTQLPRDVKLVDAETLKFFYETILRANGTSLAILNGDYTKAQKEAYYEHALQADIKALGQAMSKVIFTDREASFGNDIVLYPSDIVFMSMENKLAALQAGLPAGIFTKNEARELLGYPPVEGGDVMPRGYNELDETTTDSTGSDDAPAQNEV
jgi:HK97 family phage portal protein